MIDSITILTQSGVHLWSQSYIKDEHLINDLIENVIIPESKISQIDNYNACWETENTHNLMIICFYSKVIELDYAQDLLKSVIAEFANRYKGNYKPISDFSSIYEIILKAFEGSVKKGKAPRKFEETKKFQSTVAGSNSLPNSSEDSSILNEIEDKLQKKVPRPYQPKKNKNSPKASNKVKRDWGVDGVPLNKSDDLLDFSKQDETDVSTVNIGSGLVKDEQGVYNAPELTVKKGSFFKFFENITAGRPLTSKEIEPAVQRMNEHLVAKNVSAPVAEHICGRVSKALVGKTVSTLQSIDKLVKLEISEILSTILTPGSSTDLLSEVRKAQQKKKTYVIVFIGVNGVGKSTNLSKTCFWLLQNDCSVLVAACDTFRSGAVEQLRVHVRNLSSIEDMAKVELFDRGYGKDPAGIAREAINHANSEGFDVCLIDTAGRMQDNEPLMRALAKLVATNSPDKIIFVGEALVGNEAVDQLTRFNQALKDYSGQQNPQQIDGMILSKFDTVDDKVGAALSMTFVTGKPIFFLGVGQTYTDLRRMNVESVVETLLQ